MMNLPKALYVIHNGIIYLICAQASGMLVEIRVLKVGVGFVGPLEIMIVSY